MKAVLQRGKGPLSASADRALFHFGQPMPEAAQFGEVYSIDWEGGHPCVLRTKHLCPEPTAIALRQDNSGLYSFSHKEFGLILLRKSLWFEDHLERAEGQGLLLSYQGWQENEWFDGPYGRWRDGEYSDFILPGDDFAVELGSEESPLNGFKDWFDEHKFAGQKQSLLQAVRQKYSLREETLLKYPEGNISEVLNLLLLRLAFPDKDFYLLPRDLSWKRLAQNLGVSPLQQPKKHCDEASLNATWGSDSAVLELLRWQMKRSPFIPNKLWNDLSN